MQTFAGVIALLNDFRLSQGKSSLGFLNPIIYSTGVPGFNDITSGSNPGCGTNGFTAGAGWDPVSVAADLGRPAYYHPLHSLTSPSLRSPASAHPTSASSRLSLGERRAAGVVLLQYTVYQRCSPGRMCDRQQSGESNFERIRRRDVARACQCGPCRLVRAMAWVPVCNLAAHAWSGSAAARGRSASAFIRSDEGDKVVAAERAPPRRIEQISQEPAAARGVWKPAAAAYVVVRGRGRPGVQEGLTGTAHARAHAGRREEERRYAAAGCEKGERAVGRQQRAAEDAPQTWPLGHTALSASCNGIEA